MRQWGRVTEREREREGQRDDGCMRRRFYFVNFWHVSWLFKDDSVAFCTSFRLLIKQFKQNKTIFMPLKIIK